MIRLAIALLLGGLSLAPARARACSGFGPDPVLITERHPDSPLRRFVKGNLGIIRPTFARTYLVVAYRYLAGMPLDGAEQAGALAVWQYRGAGRICEEKWLRPSLPLPPTAIETWQAARRVVTGTVDNRLWAGTVVQASASYGGADNCLDEAFRAAASTLTARGQTWGAGSPALKAWVGRQDAVFANCNTKTPVPVPPPPPDADALARADFAYQTAAAAF
jgi:hypothetical protein